MTINERILDEGLEKQGKKIGEIWNGCRDKSFISKRAQTYR